MFYFFFKTSLGILQESLEKYILSLWPFLFIICIFFKNCGLLFAVVVLCGNLECTMEISNGEEEFETDPAKRHLCQINPKILGMLSIRTSLHL